MLEPEAATYIQRRRKQEIKEPTPTISPEEIWKRLPLEERKYYYVSGQPQMMPSAPRVGRETPALHEKEYTEYQLQKQEKKAAYERAQVSVFQESLTAFPRPPPEPTTREKLFEVMVQSNVAIQQITQKVAEIEYKVAKIQMGPKGLAELMASWETPTYSPYKWSKGIYTTRPLAFPAGIVASAESFFYSALRLGGMLTPRPPPTFTGGLVGKGVELFTRDPTYELEKTMGYGGEYAVGTLFGDVLLAKYVFGPVVGKAGGAIKGKAQTWLTTQYLEKGPTTWKGFTEKVVMKLTGAKPYFPVGEVAIPDISKGALSMAKLEASYGAWEMTLAPRTGGVWIGKYVI